MRCLLPSVILIAFCATPAQAGECPDAPNASIDSPETTQLKQDKLRAEIDKLRAEIANLKNESGDGFALHQNRSMAVKSGKADVDEAAGYWASDADLAGMSREQAVQKRADEIEVFKARGEVPPPFDAKRLAQQITGR